MLLAAYHPGFRLLGISTVHGNASLERTTNNALSVLAAMGKEDQISVHAGASQALVVSSLQTVASLLTLLSPTLEALGLTRSVRERDLWSSRSSGGVPAYIKTH